MTSAVWAAWLRQFLPPASVPDGAGGPGQGAKDSGHNQQGGECDDLAEEHHHRHSQGAGIG
jgi:hypothetical protein